MVFYRYFLTFLLAVLGANFAKCTEFVPAFIWGTSKISEHVPALHKISEDSFKDTLLEYIKTKPYIIVFAEYSLSPEDFAQCHQSGAFHNLHEIKQTLPTSYIPSVQNPIGAIKQLNIEVTEFPIKSLINNPNVPKDNILIIDLNDAKDDEQRCNMIKRHDSDIATIFKDIAEQHSNVLAIYTAHHSSWVSSEEVTHKKTRDLLQTQEPDDNKSATFNTSYVLMYISDKLNYSDSSDANPTLSDNVFKAESTVDNSNLTLKLTHEAPSITISFKLYLEPDNGYWRLVAVDVVEDSETVHFKVPEIYVPFKPNVFSYHCGNLVLKGLDDTKKTLTIPGFQIQPGANGSNPITFGDAYDCVGFTSIPIWAGLFVTALLLLIMTFGLTMMMDIKTMDRFDDSKGKTITINAAE